MEKVRIILAPPSLWVAIHPRSQNGVFWQIFINAMESMKDFDPWGLSGPVTWGPDDREGSESGILYKADVDTGMMVPISNWRKPLPR